MYGSLSEALGDEVTVDTPIGTLIEFADKHGVSVDPKWGPGKLAEELFDELVVGHAAGADVRPGLSGRDVAADPGPSRDAGPGREVGPLHSRCRDRHRRIASWSTR